MPLMRSVVLEHVYTGADFFVVKVAEVEAYFWRRSTLSRLVFGHFGVAKSADLGQIQAKGEDASGNYR